MLLAPPPGKHSLNTDLFPGCILFNVQNYASFMKHFDVITDAANHISLYQECSVADADTPKVKSSLDSKGYRSDFSCSCPESNKPVAGVATIARQPSHVSPITPVTDDFRNALLTGRILICLYSCEGRALFYVVNVYGWTNGHKCPTQASRTCALIQAAVGELQHHPVLPCAIAWDINANTADIPSLTNLIDGGWTDVGVKAHFWNRTPPCFEQPRPYSKGLLFRQPLAFAHDP